jgi:hypothetical protein
MGVSPFFQFQLTLFLEIRKLDERISERKRRSAAASRLWLPTITAALSPQQQQPTRTKTLPLQITTTISEKTLGFGYKGR